MPEITREQIARLPRWAQQERERLIRLAEDAVRDRDALAAEKATDTADGWVDPYGFPKPVVPRGEVVRFYLADAPDVPDGLRQRWRSDWIDVRLYRARDEAPVLEVRGDHGLTIRPSASNVAYIGQAER